jgi:hypothetical protein
MNRYRLVKEQGIRRQTLTRTQVANEAGLSERQRKIALCVARVPGSFEATTRLF